MIKRILIIFLFFATIHPMDAHAQNQVREGTITYVNAGTVYTSLGRKDGLQDSSLVHVTAGRDTLATLKVFAVSSSSSACNVVTSKRKLRVGQSVVTFIQLAAEPDVTTTTPVEVATEETSQIPMQERSPNKVQRRYGVHGRVSLQYFTSLSAQSALNRAQPSLIVNLRGSAPNHPVKFEIYSNARTTMRGSSNPFGSGSENRTRLYRMNMTYDNKSTIVSIGRFSPRFAPSTGFIDGATVSQRIGQVTIGTAFGLQPDAQYQKFTPDYRKIAIYTQIQPANLARTSLSVAYGRTYHKANIDRESISTMFSMYASRVVSVYSYSEINLRKRVDGQFKLMPDLSTMITSVRFRVNRKVSLGIGGDAARPLYSFTSIAGIPDSLLDTRMRAGLTLRADLTIARGVGFNQSFTPRSSDNGFGRAYSNNTSFRLTNLGGSGLSLRGTLTLNKSTVTTIRSFGGSIRRQIGETDLTLRYQQSRYRLSRLSSTPQNNTNAGFDIVQRLSSHFMFLMTYEYSQGFGPRGNTIFSQFSWRI